MWPAARAGISFERVHGGWETCGPDNRFGAVLFVEKEGFMPLFRAVKLAERYDLAIMSTKGLSTTAARQLVDHLVGEKKVPVFCIRDFDLDGFKIAGTLREGTRRYSWRSRGAIDLGLRGEDIETWDLEQEEVFYRGAGGRLLDDEGSDQEEDQANPPRLWRHRGRDRNPSHSPRRAQRVPVRSARRVDRGQAGGARGREGHPERRSAPASGTRVRA